MFTDQPINQSNNQSIKDLEDSMLELVYSSEDDQGVQGVDQREGEVAKWIVYVPPPGFSSTVP